MTLLAPGAMLLAAALSLPVLAVFYLLKLRRRPLRVTSTMLWDQAARDLEVNVPFRWIRPSWLLLLHALILAALLIAIGRPALTDASGGAGRVFLLIDRSASMNAPADAGEPAGPTRLERAKARARELVAGYADSAMPPEVTVIAFAAEPEIVGPPARDAGSIGAMIDAVTPTDQPGNPAAAAALVRSLTTAGARASDDDPEDEGEIRARRTLAVAITDGGDLGDRPLAIGNTPTGVEIVGDASAGRPANLGIVGFAADREIETPAFVRIFVRLVNTGPTAASVPLVVRLDGEPIARRAVAIPEAAGTGAAFRAGQRAESVRLAIPEGGVLTVEIERTDALAADNAVHAVLPPVRRPAVLVVVPDAGPADGNASDPRARTDEILLDVLEAIGTAGVRVIDRRRYASADAAYLADFGLVVFDRVRPPQPPAAPSLSFGAPLPGSARTPSFVRASEAGRTPVLAWDRGHPVMRDVVLDTIVVGDRFAYPEDDDAGGRTDSAVGSESEDNAGRAAERTTLARGRDGPLIVALEGGSARRIAVAFPLDQTNWPVHFSFPIFLLSAFDFLVPNTDSASWEETGAPIAIDPPAVATRGGGPVEIAIEGPATRTVVWDPVRGAGRVPVGLLARAGLYTVRARGEATPLPVNLLAPDESSLAVGTNATASADAGSLAGGGRVEGREIWRWFLLAAGAGLLLEWAVFYLRSRA